MEDHIKKLRELTERLPFMGFSQPEVPVRVLVVEEEKSINRLILDTPEYFGCNCTSAKSGTDAMEKIALNDFDVLLANIVLHPVGEGAKVVKTFQDKSPNSIVIIMSSDEDRLKDYSKYFATLAMPFGLYDLIKKVKNGVKDKR